MHGYFFGYNLKSDAFMRCLLSLKEMCHDYFGNCSKTLKKTPWRKHEDDNSNLNYKRVCLAFPWHGIQPEPTVANQFLCF